MNDLFKNWKTIPNLISFIRIILVPVFVVLYLKGHTITAVSVLAVSGLTDCFDGKIARKFNQISALGKILDPVADKLTEISIAIVLLIKFHQCDSVAMKYFSWVFILFLVKELIMLFVGAIMLSKGIKPEPAEIYGKIATTVFYFVMILIIGFAPQIGAFSSYDLRLAMPEWMVMTLVVISLVLTFVALISYVPPTISKFREYKNNSGEN